MDMRPGYKKTEVGVIPKEWEVSPLESVARIVDPQPDHRTPPETAGGEPYIGISDFLDDYTVNWDASRRIIPEAVDKQQSNFRIQSGDIVFGKIGTIGSPKFLPIAPFRFALSANVLLIQPRIEPSFVMSWLRSETCQRAITSELHSTSQAAFGINKMRRVMIPLPPRLEQRAIAAASSDMDALLGGLDRLIAKKRDLKQAAMQQLLTGQTRLPGFLGEWEMKRLGELAEMGSGGTPLSSVPAYYDGDIPWVAISDMTKGGKFIQSTERTLTALGLAKSAAQMFPAGTVLYAMYASLGECSIARVSLCTSQAILGIQPKSSLDAGFLYYYLTSLKSFVKTLGQQGTQSNLNKGMVQDFRLGLPSVAEQTAIADVLFGMDTELAALDARRNKTRALKQGMMQELLTGRTRLVPAGGADA